MKFSAALFLCSVATVTAGYDSHLRRRQLFAPAPAPAPAPLPPKQDPWYTAPPGFETATPGTILREREVPELAKKNQNAGAAWQFLFRSTDSRGQPTWAVTTLLIPSTAPRDYLVSYQFPYNTPNVDTSPSYGLYQGSNLPGQNDVVAALGRGWYVVAPDFEGPKASFGAGVIAGQVTLDSVRAVLKSNKGLTKAARYALWGYSGGSIPTEWAIELQGSYAPELKFAGTAVGGIAANITAVLVTVNKSSASCLVPLGVIGLCTQYPELNSYVQSQLMTTGLYTASTFDSVYNGTLVDAIGKFFLQDISLYFRDGQAGLFSKPFQLAVENDGIMGKRGVPLMPVFAYQGVNDQLSPIANTDKLINSLCARGATIDYQRNGATEHFADQFKRASDAMAFLQSTLDGTYSRQGCRITTTLA